ncbi:MAG: HAD family phosphatase [Candidatus Aenigmarchaeota archaeon]|nr:HAD family phosphatase [Candidatus Aenigmarchaeota archaeon]
MIKALIFDMDGVLVNSEKPWERFEVNFLKQFIPGFSSEHNNEFKGTGIHDMFVTLKKKFNLRMTEHEFMTIFEEQSKSIYSSEAVVVPGAQELLETLKKRYTLALGSSSQRSWITIVLDRFHWNPLFTTVICSNDVGGKAKPDPAIYSKVAEQLGVRADECIVIEDSINGVRAAKAADMCCIGFENPESMIFHLTEADYVVGSLDQIETTIKNFEKESSVNRN